MRTSLKIVMVLLAFAAILAFMLAPLVAFADTATLTWPAPTDPSVTGFKVYQGTISGQYGTPVDVGNVTTHTVTLPTSTVDQTYFFVITDYNANGESAKSNEVSKLVKGVPPVFVKTLTDAAGHVWALAGTAPTYDLYMDGTKLSIGSDIQLVSGTVYTQGTGTDTANWWVWKNAAWVKVGPLPVAPAAPSGLVISSASPSQIIVTASAADCPSVTLSGSAPTYTVACGR